MSEASSTPAKGSTNKAEPRARRISNPRPKKLAKATIAGANKINELTPGGKAMTDNTKGNIAGAVAGGVVGNYAGKKVAGAINSVVAGKVVVRSPRGEKWVVTVMATRPGTEAPDLWLKF